MMSDEEAVDDIELAYREALRSIDEAEQQVGSALMDAADDFGPSSESEPSAFNSIGEQLAEDLAASAAGGSSEPVVDGRKRVSPKSVVEAALFVGGEVSLTARRLASLIGQDTDSRLAVRLIDQLNDEYASEQRPYEIRLQEGGFALELREEYSEVKVKTFGLGPREVRLSPEALETLAFVAYNQPVSRADLEQTSLRNALTLVRQLIRLRLIEVDGVGNSRKDVQYRTGDRFLKLFGLKDLSDLPQADIFSFK